jgi:outer membrane lipoprotein LolB
VSLRFAAVFVALLASGCATVTPPVQTGDRAERRVELQALDDWILKGRVAVAAGADGFSGGMNWVQRGEKAEITLRGPMGSATMRILVEGVHFAVTDGHGRTLDGDEARQFVEQSVSLGTPLPIAEMRYWLVGTPAPGSDYRETMGEGGSLSGLEQSGWTVRYDRIRAVGNLALPERIEMTTEGLRLRVAVSDWRLAP